tara:strand:- start:15 stop:320 length:306 start_codon:yes stop_codon:yes gene_type:complete
MAIVIPNDYKGKTQEEIFKDLDTIAKAYMQLKDAMSDLHAEIKLRDSRIQLLRADVKKLKSMIGMKNIEIKNLKLESDNIIDITPMDTIERQDGSKVRIYK